MTATPQYDRDPPHGGGGGRYNYKRTRNMELKLKRTTRKADYTIGDLYIDGQWSSNTLEPHAIDWETQEKTPGRTAIPEGRYRIRLARSAHFGRAMPYLQAVPHFTGVMIHPGMTARDTKGCILVGHNTIRGTLLRTRQTFDALMARLTAADKRGERISIEVT